jgi:hypothetical protein
MESAGASKLKKLERISSKKRLPLRNALTLPAGFSRGPNPSCGPTPFIRLMIFESNNI